MVARPIYSLKQTIIKTVATSEIRWFSTERTLLWIFYDAFPNDNALEIEHRTDHYLKSNLSGTGVKIRGGKLETKLKTAPDKPMGEFPGSPKMESWIKWSSDSPYLILDSIQYTLRSEWLPVRKARNLKRFELVGNEFRGTTTLDITKGCSVEFTRIDIPGYGGPVFTVCMEAIGESHETKAILQQAIDYYAPPISSLRHLVCCGYPEYLKK